MALLSAWSAASSAPASGKARSPSRVRSARSLLSSIGAFSIRRARLGTGGRGDDMEPIKQDMWGLRYCRYCRAWWPLELFCRAKHLPSGYTRECRACRSERRVTGRLALRRCEGRPTELSRVSLDCSGGPANLSECGPEWRQRAHPFFGTAERHQLAADR